MSSTRVQDIEANINALISQLDAQLQRFRDEVAAIKREHEEAKRLREQQSMLYDVSTYFAPLTLAQITPKPGNFLCARISKCPKVDVTTDLSVTEMFTDRLV